MRSGYERESVRNQVQDIIRDIKISVFFNRQKSNLFMYRYNDSEMSRTCIEEKKPNPTASHVPPRSEEISDYLM